MKVRCDRTALLDAVTLAGGVVPTRSPKPALQCVKLEAKDKKLTLSATDLDNSIRCRVGMVDITEPGAAVIPADRLIGILRETRDQELEIHTEGDACRVIAAESKFKVFGFDPAEFPPTPDFPEPAGFSVKADVLKQMIARTVFAAAKEITRYAINGVLWEPKGDRLKMVGTDGKRLAQARGPLAGPAADERAAVCPLKAMAVLEKLLVDPESYVEAKFADNDLRVRCGSSVLSFRLVEGGYPKYDEVIPKECDKTAEVSSEAFTNRLKQASLLVDAASKRVVFKFSPERLELRSTDPQKGEAEITMTGKPASADDKQGPDYSYTGSALRIEFNPDYIIEGLKALGEPRAYMEFKTPDRPGVLKSGQDFVYVVMPLSSRGGED
jgi:DNA polymerase-3 subunit beta